MIFRAWICHIFPMLAYVTTVALRIYLGLEGLLRTVISVVLTNIMTLMIYILLLVMVSKMKPVISGGLIIGLFSGAVALAYLFIVAVKLVFCTGMASDNRVAVSIVFALLMLCGENASFKNNRIDVAIITCVFSALNVATNSLLREDCNALPKTVRGNILSISLGSGLLVAISVSLFLAGAQQNKDIQMWLFEWKTNKSTP